MAFKIGLALSGGGSKGAFTVGVLGSLRQAFRKAEIRVISGTSTGALVGTLAAEKKWSRLRKVYTGVVTKDIIHPKHTLVARLAGPEAVLFASAILGGTSIFDTAPLEEMIRTQIDFKNLKARADETLLIYNTVDMQTGKVVTFDTKSSPLGVLPKALLASANQPVLTPLVDIGDHQYADGGVREYLPVAPVFDSGVKLDHIFAIATEPQRPSGGQSRYEQITDILGRTVGLLSSEVGFMDAYGAQLMNTILAMVENAAAHGFPKAKLLAGIPDEVRKKLGNKSRVGLTFVGPPKHLDMDSLEFEPDKMKKALALGEKVGRQVFLKLKAQGVG